MLKRQEYCDGIHQVVQEYTSRRRFFRAVNTELNRLHNFYDGNQVMLSEDVTDFSDEILFWVGSAINSVLGTEKIHMNEYFSPHEFQMYKKSRMQIENTVEYPVVFNNVQKVAEDQYICVTDSEFIYQLYQGQLINYNYNTQRPAVKKTLNGITSYKIAVNEKSVKEIAKLMKQNEFIPNALTLNANLDNENTAIQFNGKELFLTSGQLDILDGFHRYRAITMLRKEDETFRYPVILNIMQFDEEKACTYIAQEDKRNRIKKSYAKTLDATNPINFIIQRLNTDSLSYLRGKISRSHGYLAQDFYQAIEQFCDATNQMATYKRLRNVYNSLMEENVLTDDKYIIALATKAGMMYDSVEDMITFINNHKYDSHVSNFKHYLKTLDKAEG